jgi:hypothetical protein
LIDRSEVIYALSAGFPAITEEEANDLFDKIDRHSPEAITFGMYIVLRADDHTLLQPTNPDGLTFAFLDEFSAFMRKFPEYFTVWKTYHQRKNQHRSLSNSLRASLILGEED